MSNIADDVLIGIDLILHFVIKISPIKGRLEYPSIQDAEILQDIALDLRRGRSGKGYYRRTTYLVHNLADAPVLRAEIVSPLGDTMRFVHGKERDIDLTEEFDITFFG